MQAWAKPKAPGNFDASETPLRRPRPPAVQNISPSKQKSPARHKRAGPSALPGFQNSFTTSTPILSPKRTLLKLDKGKGKSTNEPWPAPSQPLFAPPIPRNESSQPPDMDDLFFQPAEIEPTPIPNAPISSAPLGESQSAKFDEGEEDVLEYEPIPPINWCFEVFIFRLYLEVFSSHRASASPHLANTHIPRLPKVDTSNSHRTEPVGFYNALLETTTAYRKCFKA